MFSKRNRRPGSGAASRRVRASLGITPGPNGALMPAGAPTPARIASPAAAAGSPATLERLEGRMMLAADFLISEFMASNGGTLADKDGAYSDWIEVHNRGNAAGSLDGWFLTDDGSNLGQWRFPAVTVPAGGYLLAFASGKNLATAGQELHTNFKLDGAGEYLALVKPDGFTVQSAFAPSYPSQSSDVSYGPTNENDPASGLQFFTKPTPGTANNANAPEPLFSADSRTFAASFALALSLPASAPAGSEIHYTTDRSLPTAASPKYTAPINISNSTIVRALVTAPGRSPSPVVSQTYVALDASVQSFNSNLPVVVMDTFGAGLNDTTLTGVSAYFIDTSAADGRAEMLDAPDFAGRGGLRFRGQSSQGFPKAPYAFETWEEDNSDKDVSILGMPKESDWILYNPYSEKSLMQNALAYMWGDRMGNYTVRTRYVELFVNQGAGSKVDYGGDYKGIYLFMEKIKIDNDRVDIEKLTPQDNAAPEVTGGYIWAKDKFDAGERGFYAGGQQWTFKDPSENEVTPEQESYLTGYINEFASVLNGPNYKDPVNGYAKYIDVDSWIDHHIMVELTKNIDGFRISTYYYKDRNGKIVSGPIWDYNLSLGNADYLNGQSPTGWYGTQLGEDEYPYWRRLFSDPTFQQKYIDRWQQLRKNEFSTQRLMADIDGLVQLLSDGNGNYPVGTNPQQAPNNALVRNFQKWRVLGTYVWPNGHVDSQGRWIEEVNWMKDWLRQRLQWWDSQYLAMPTIAPNGGPATGPTQVSITSAGGTSTVETPLLSSGAPAKALVPTSDIGTAWRTALAGFNEAGWLAGTTGVGYDDDPASGGDYTGLLGLSVSAPPDGQTPTPMRNSGGSLYARVPFNVPAGTNPASIQALVLKMRYDDGFVAYLNGTEIARSSNGVPADPAWDSFGGGSHDAAGFEEFDVTQFRGLLQPGANLLAIQGINTTLGSSDLLMLPELVMRSSVAQPAPVYYTTDGSDPRLPSGGISPTARLYTDAFVVTGTTRVRARSLVGSRWSGLADELYDSGENRLRVTELMYNPTPPLPTSPYLPGDFEYVEVQNTGTSTINLAGVRFDKGIDFTFGSRTLAPGARVLVVRNQAAFESRYGTALRPLIAGTFTGALSDGGERVRLQGAVGETVTDFTYSDDWYKQTDGEGYSLTIVNPAAPVAAWNTKAGWRASEPFGGTPGAGDNGIAPNSVVINEILSNPAAGAPDGDWIELRNTTAAPVNIGGWWLSDVGGSLQKWQIPAGTTIPANGYRVFTQTADFGAAFSLSAAGEGVYLSSGDSATGALGGYRVDETFNGSDAGVTFGRYLTSTGADLTAMVSATRGAANSAPLVGPVVINEIMYSPTTGKAEYVELRNLSGVDVPLYLAGSTAVTWRFSGGIDFAFPAGAVIPANGYAIVAAVDAAAFRQQYSDVPAAVPVWGPYTLPNGVNVLSDNGETIRLQRPQAGTAPRPYVDVDLVAYDDEAPWPADTKGTGQSLGRLNSAAYGNDPANWDSERAGGSPGRSNFAPDFTAPTADVIDVTPDPRAVAVDQVTISFSERVSGFDLADLRLTRDGAPLSLLGDGITLATTDNGTTWALRGLSALTLLTGDYVLTVVAAGSGVRDVAGNVMAVNGSDAWRMNNSDTNAPTANIIDVSPDPRHGSVPSIGIVFSEPVVGFDKSDLILTLDGGPNLLTAATTLTSSDNRTWLLGGLTNLTTAEGRYLLTLKNTGTGIADPAGNALQTGATDDWVTDFTGPTVDIVDVTPDPRNLAVDTITFTFSEAVTGFDLADLQLRHDSGANLLTAAQTLTTADGGVTWTLGNLIGLTGLEGAYDLSLTADGSGISDVGVNGLAQGAFESWVVDTTRPTVEIESISPDPRPGSVDSVNIVFSEPVVGFALSDLQLTRRAADGSVTNVLTGAQTLTSPDGGLFWVVGNLGGATAAPGTYTLTLVSGVAAVTDAAGNSLAGDASDAWVVSAPPSSTVAGRYVFYNHSRFDGGSASAGAADDNAVATDKLALLPGQTAGVANYTSYSRGLNGIMIDLAGLPAGATLSAADFTLRVGPGGDPSAWAVAPAPASVTVRRGAGVGGSDRVTLTFADGALKNQWLQVGVNANPNTGLARRDVFYFGNLSGDTADANTPGAVGALDFVGTRNNMFKLNLPVTNRFDHNRDGRVDSQDVGLVRANMNRRLQLMVAPAAPAAAPVQPAAVFSDATIAPEAVATAAKTARVWTEAPADVLG